MVQLLSGFVGALIATILTVIYLYVSEKLKIRTDVVLEIVEFCDEFNSNICNLKYLKNKEFTQPGSQIDLEDYKAHTKNLSKLIMTTKLQAKVALIYRDGDIFENFMKLSEDFRAASKVLRRSTRSGWVIENKELDELINIKIEPLRKELLGMLLKSTSTFSITSDFVTGQYRNAKSKLTKK